MKKYFILILALLCVMITALPVCVGAKATDDQATKDQATKDYILNIKDDSLTWVYVVISAVCTAIVIIASVVIYKKVK